MTKFDFEQVVMISAMYENGGNTLHRMLDGHSNLWVYPFESQLGTKYQQDVYTGMYPDKYRWPVIPSHFDAGAIYESIIDEECKVRSKTPFVSKFREWEFELNDLDRKQYFVNLLGENKDRKSVVFAYMEATFKSWKNKYSNQQKIAVGYSPVLGIDGADIVNDLGENGKMIHIIRNPFSAYAETKSRAVPMSLGSYIDAWMTVQNKALYLNKKYPDQFLIVRYEDLIGSTEKTLSAIFSFIGNISFEEINLKPTWNGEDLGKLTPWGIVNHKTSASNLNKAKELNEEEIDDVYLRAQLFVDAFGYQAIFEEIK